MLRKLESEREQARLANDIVRQQLEVQLDAQTREAEALRAHPEILKLKQAEALSAMAKAGARFVVGLDGTDIGEFVKER